MDYGPVVHIMDNHHGFDCAWDVKTRLVGHIVQATEEELYTIVQKVVDNGMWLHITNH